MTPDVKAIGRRSSARKRHVADLTRFATRRGSSLEIEKQRQSYFLPWLEALRESTCLCECVSWCWRWGCWSARSGIHPSLRRWRAGWGGETSCSSPSRSPRSLRRGRSRTIWSVMCGRGQTECQSVVLVKSTAWMKDHLIVVPPLDVRRGRGAEPGHARQVDSWASVHVHIRPAEDLGVRLCAKFENRLLLTSKFYVVEFQKSFYSLVEAWIIEYVSQCDITL